MLVTVRLEIVAAEGGTVHFGDVSAQEQANQIGSKTVVHESVRPYVTCQPVIRSMVTT